MGNYLEKIRNFSTVRNLIEFFEYCSKESPKPFYYMLSLFVTSNMLLAIEFTGIFSEYLKPARYTINTILMIACIVYIAMSLLLWRLKLKTIFIAVILITITGFSWNVIGQTNEFFCTTIALILALLAYKRDYRKILMIVLGCHLATMIVGLIGLPLNITKLVYKLETVDYGYSMGLVYPNHVGRMVFLSLMIIWYLWGQEKRSLTTIVGFVTAYVMWTYVKCKTITFFMIGFPISWWILTLLQSHNIDSRYMDIKRKIPVVIFTKIMNMMIVGMPFLFMLFTFIMGLNRAFFMRHWHYGPGIFALWMRFISAGVLFKTYGFPLLGRDILSETAPVEYIEGKYYMANIVDNSFAYYLIAIGGIALVVCMLWMSFANYRALKNLDYAFLLMSFFISTYGLIEVIFFQFEHNYLFFYPLTATAMAYRNQHNSSDSVKTDSQEVDNES